MAMRLTTTSSTASPAVTRRGAGLRIARRPAAADAGLKLLGRLRQGSLTVHLPDGTSHRFGTSGEPVATLQVHDWSVFAAAFKSGDIGFAESYLDGGWTTPDLVALLELFIANRQQVEDLIFGTWAGRLIYRIRHRLNRNSRANSRKNVHAHYDLGNAFYGLWLDGTMNYSSAWFTDGHAGDFEAAQRAKVRRALRVAGVKPGDRLLEIGCGWGALAEQAITEFGARVTGVTLSAEQLAYAKARMERRGASAEADLRLQDYRDIGDGPYDAICSIEMVEAVGREYWPTWFGTVQRLLKSGGRACVQTIVIDDSLFRRYIASTDFIQQYVFPGGCLPCPGEFRREAQAAGLEVEDEFAFGHDYAETIRRWRERFTATREQVLQLGFDDRFMRIWDFYLAYCQAAFSQGSVDVVQYTLVKP